MDLSSPISSIIPSAHGVVLSVLARTTAPLSGRQVAGLTRGRFSQSRVNEVLGELVRAGIVSSEDRPPAKAYTLNRRHVAAEGVIALAYLWDQIVDGIRDDVEAWHPRAEAAWIFGSAARGDAGPDSDIDVLVVRPEVQDGSAEESMWEQQVAELSENVAACSGNHCEILELTVAELRSAVNSDNPLVLDLRDHGIALTGHTRRLLRKDLAG